MNRYIALIPVIFGIIMIICGLIIKDRPRGKIKNGIHTDAIIKDFAEKTSYVKKTPYRALSPIIEFNTPDGKVSAVYPFFINEDYIKFRRGDIIKICYDKNNFNKFHIENDNSKNNLALIFILSGSFVIISDILMFLQYS